jgi:uncharacterized protein (UPF0332 family)
MNPSALEQAYRILDKAEDALQTAKHDLKGGFLLATANRAYYACYYCMTALLYTQDLYAKTHQGVRAKFSEIFIKTSLLPIEVSDDIALLFKYRQEADYDLEADISEDDAKELIEKAASILQIVKQFLIQRSK